MAKAIGRPRKTDEQNAFNVRLGYRIQKLREERKIKITELARMLGICYSQLYHYEVGDSGVPVYLLPLIAHVLGVEVATLVQV